MVDHIFKTQVLNNEIRFFQYIRTHKNVQYIRTHKMCTYTDTHREKGCSFIELAVNLTATTRKKKFFQNP